MGKKEITKEEKKPISSIDKKIKILQALILKLQQKK